MAEYDVGDILFYPRLGPVKLIEWQQRDVAGKPMVFSIWRGFDDSLGVSHSIPLDKIDRVLRPLATREEADQIFEALRENMGDSSLGKYATRIRDQRDKINQGNFLDMAEIARDLSRRRGQPRPRALTDAEKRNLEQVMKVLSQELGVTLGIGAKAAEKKIVEAISSDKSA